MGNCELNPLRPIYLLIGSFLLCFSAEFKRAVKVATGQELSNNILDTVFKIFDLDGDECLSHGEFLGVLKNRMHRGLWVTDFSLFIFYFFKSVFLHVSNNGIKPKI